jgi:hypothetical protein
MPLPLFHCITRVLEGVPRHAWELLDPPGRGRPGDARTIGILLPSGTSHPEQEGTVVVRLAGDAMATVKG